MDGNRLRRVALPLRASGELPPFDHPHVFLDMGDAAEIICPYCSTLFRHDPSLPSRAARPAECMLPENVIV